MEYAQAAINSGVTDLSERCCNGHRGAFRDRVALVSASGLNGRHTLTTGETVFVMVPHHWSACAASSGNLWPDDSRTSIAARSCCCEFKFCNGYFSLLFGNQFKTSSADKHAHFYVLSNKVIFSGFNH